MMLQAIRVQYLGPTNYRGARLKATCDAGTATISYPYESNRDEGHRAAAQALLDKLGWDYLMVGGVLKDGSTAFVLMGERHPLVQA